MKSMIAALTIALAFAFTAPAYAKVDKDSPEHKEWVEKYRKKHDIKGKPVTKKPAAKKKKKT